MTAPNTRPWPTSRRMVLKLVHSGLVRRCRRRGTSWVSRPATGGSHHHVGTAATLTAYADHPATQAARSRVTFARTRDCANMTWTTISSQNEPTVATFQRRMRTNGKDETMTNGTD